MSEVTIDYYELKRLQDIEKLWEQINERLAPLEKHWCDENNVTSGMMPGTDVLISWIEGKVLPKSFNFVYDSERTTFC